MSPPLKPSTKEQYRTVVIRFPGDYPLCLNGLPRTIAALANFLFPVFDLASKPADQLLLVETCTIFINGNCVPRILYVGIERAIIKFHSKFGTMNEL
jgi:hypothetical protein